MYQLMSAGDVQWFWGFELDNEPDVGDIERLLAPDASAELKAQGYVLRFDPIRFSRMRCARMTPPGLFGSFAHQVFYGDDGHPEFVENYFAFWRSQGRFPEVIWPSGILAVSERIRAIVEQLEPDVHQFLPIEVRSLKNCVPTERRYLFNILHWVRALTPDRTGVCVRQLTNKHIALDGARWGMDIIVSNEFAKLVGELPEQHGTSLSYTPLKPIFDS